MLQKQLSLDRTNSIAAQYKFNNVQYIDLIQYLWGEECPVVSVWHWGEVVHLSPPVCEWAQFGGLKLAHQPIIPALEAAEFDGSGILSDGLGLAV